MAKHQEISNDISIKDTNVEWQLYKALKYQRYQMAKYQEISNDISIRDTNVEWQLYKVLEYQRYSMTTYRSCQRYQCQRHWYQMTATLSPKISKIPNDEVPRGHQRWTLNEPPVRRVRKKGEWSQSDPKRIVGNENLEAKLVWKVFGKFCEVLDWTTNWAHGPVYMRHRLAILYTVSSA